MQLPLTRPRNLVPLLATPVERRTEEFGSFDSYPSRAQEDKKRKEKKRKQRKREGKKGCGG